MSTMNFDALLIFTPGCWRLGAITASPQNTRVHAEKKVFSEHPIITGLLAMVFYYGQIQRHNYHGQP
jgi:hypothetical protein